MAAVRAVPLLSGWSGSVGPGVQRGHPVAWILVGNFRFAGDYAATHEGAPSVPAGKVLISIGDFVPDGASRHWMRVRRLQLAQRRITARAVSWHVRFAGRAVRLTVRFGTRPSVRTVRLANSVLGSVTRLR